MILLDTNVISEPWKPAPDTAVLTWLDEQAVETLLGRLALGHHMALVLIPCILIIAAIAFGVHHFARSSEKT